MLNGSRVNPLAPVDIMQDYDIVFFINDLESSNYKTDRNWMNQFGQLVIFQQNDFEDNSYIFLMQFSDVRIDLRFADMTTVNEVIKEDTLNKILLDKDNQLKPLPNPNDKAHWVKKPSQKEWEKLLNEVWWIQTYIAKGIWRDELPYVKYMYDVILIDCIRKLLSWYIGVDHDWKINVGKCEKWFKRLLKSHLYNQFILLYSNHEYQEIWSKLFDAGKLIHKVGTELSTRLGYRYPINDEINVSEFISKLKNLPEDAKEII